MSGFWWGFWWGVVATAISSIIVPDGGRYASRFFAQIGWTVFRASMAGVRRQRQIDSEQRETR